MVVIVIILILALLLAGVIPGLKKSSSSSSGVSYTVTFSETGLPSGTTWSVTLAGSTQTGTAPSTIAFSEKNGTYAFTVGTVTGYAASPSSGSLTVNGANVAQAIKFTPGYSVTFTESGLPSGTSWSVTLNGTTLSSTTTTVVFSESNGTYAYSVGAVTGYTSAPSSGSVTVHGAAVPVSITFTATAVGTYTVTFTETGLPSGTNWSVTLNGTTMHSVGTSIVFTEKNGNYPYSVGTVTGYTATPSSGTVPVSSAAASVSITFTKTAVPSGPAYAVTFDQTGLPSTILWEVDASWEGGIGYGAYGQSSTGPSTEFAVPDGTYYWAVTSQSSTYAPIPAYGNFTVNGAPVTVHIVFQTYYDVSFNETGLSSTANWQVTLNGSTEYSTGDFNITFMEFNGTYSFSVYAFGYTATPATGTVTVNGANVSKTITFTALPAYTVTFMETGLATGHFWEVELNESFNSTSAPGSITFKFPNGVYNFTVYVTGYTASPESGTITVSSAPVSEPITFTLIKTYSVTFTETGLVSGTDWSVFVDGLDNFTTAPSSIGFLLPVGTYAWDAYATGYVTQVGNITVTTSGGSQAVVFTKVVAPTTYQVTVTETGLPAFSFWGIDIESNYPVVSSYYNCDNTSFTETSGPSGLNCTLANGWYTLVAGTDSANYTASPMSVGFQVNGAPVSITTEFVNSSNESLVWFGEEWYSFTGVSGLPNGTSWSVTYDGMTNSTDGLSLFFLGPNGTQASYTVKAPTGYVVLPSAGNLTSWGNSEQSDLYYLTSAHVFLIFLASDPPPATPSYHGVSGPSVTGFDPALATVRDR